jgi:hypothetical protein
MDTMSIRRDRSACSAASEAFGPEEWHVFFFLLSLPLQVLNLKCLGVCVMFGGGRTWNLDGLGMGKWVD